MEREDDWGRGRGGRTAVVREGRMMEARWVTQRKKGVSGSGIGGSAHASRLLNHANTKEQRE